MRNFPGFHSTGAPWFPEKQAGARGVYRADVGVTLGGPAGATAVTVANQVASAAADLGWDPTNPDVPDPVRFYSDGFGGTSPVPGIQADGLNDRLFLKPIGTPSGSGTKETLSGGLSAGFVIRLDPTNRDFSYPRPVAGNRVFSLRPGDATKVKSFAGKVHQVIDRAGPSGTLIGDAWQRIESRKPSIVSGALRFSGGDCHLYTTRGLPNACTVYAAVRLTGFGANTNVFAMTAGTGISDGGPPFGIRANNGGVWQILTQADYITTTKACVVGDLVCFIATMTTGAQEAFVNNVSAGTRTDGTNNGGSGLFLGTGVYNVFPGFFGGAQCEFKAIDIFDAVHNSSDRTAHYNRLVTEVGPFA